jgi:uncharacterized protein (DUF983 family)
MSRSYPPLSPAETGLRNRCPRCGQGKLFSGYLALRPACDVCGLDYDFADAGDGPAVFIILFAGFLVVGLALWVEFTYQPAYWVHAILWGPLILAVTLLPIRPLKGWMIAQQYAVRAREGRLEKKAP